MSCRIRQPTQLGLSGALSLTPSHVLRVLASTPPAHIPQYEAGIAWWAVLEWLLFGALISYFTLSMHSYPQSEQLRFGILRVTSAVLPTTDARAKPLIGK